jgi:hypothetical protein
MSTYFESLWDRAVELPGETWTWFDGLNREEWLVTLAIVCVFGFLCLLGFQTRRL